MEAHYWWYRKNNEALERGEFPIKNAELEEKLGHGLIFDYEPWMGPNFLLKGKNGQFAVDVFQYPRNCGHLIAGYMNVSIAEIQTFIVKNFMSANGYGVCDMSIHSNPETEKVWEKYGWKKVYQAPSSRNSGSMTYFMLEVTHDQMLVKGGYGGDDTFIPAQYKDKVAAPFWALGTQHDAQKALYRDVAKPVKEPAKVK